MISTWLSQENMTITKLHTLALLSTIPCVYLSRMILSSLGCIFCSQAVFCMEYHTLCKEIQILWNQSYTNIKLLQQLSVSISFTYNIRRSQFCDWNDKFGFHIRHVLSWISRTSTTTVTLVLVINRPLNSQFYHETHSFRLLLTASLIKSNFSLSKF